MATYTLATVENASSLTTRRTSARCRSSDMWNASRKSLNIFTFISFRMPWARNVLTTLEYDCSSAKIQIPFDSRKYVQTRNVQSRQWRVSEINLWANSYLIVATFHGIHLVTDPIISATFCAWRIPSAFVHCTSINEWIDNIWCSLHKPV